jgi:hypothetical protein
LILLTIPFLLVGFVELSLLTYFAVVVTISSATPFRGYILHARRFGQTSIVGNFVLSGSSEQLDDEIDVSDVSTTPSWTGASSVIVKTVNCDAPEDTLVAWHGSTGSTKEVSYVWNAPDEDVGPVQFMCVFIQSVTLKLQACPTAV